VGTSIFWWELGQTTLRVKPAEVGVEPIQDLCFLLAEHKVN
jgi:hypothetical protein